MRHPFVSPTFRTLDAVIYETIRALHIESRDGYPNQQSCPSGGSTTTTVVTGTWVDWVIVATLSTGGQVDVHNGATLRECTHVLAAIADCTGHDKRAAVEEAIRACQVEEELADDLTPQRRVR